MPLQCFTFISYVIERHFVQKFHIDQAEFCQTPVNSKSFEQIKWSKVRTIFTFFTSCKLSQIHFNQMLTACTGSWTNLEQMFLGLKTLLYRQVILTWQYVADRKQKTIARLICYMVCHLLICHVINKQSISTPTPCTCYDLPTLKDFVIWMILIRTFWQI